MLLMPWCAECNVCSTYLQRCDGITIWLSIRAILFVTFNRFPLSSVSVDWGGGGSGLLISVLEKLNWPHLTSLITLVLLIIEVTMDWPALEKKLSLKMLGLTFFSKLHWGYNIISIAKIASKGIKASFHSMKFLCPVSLQIYHMTMHGLLLSYPGWCF